MSLAPDAPTIVVIAGPNGAGKSTTAPVLLNEMLGLREFVNADVIARPGPIGLRTKGCGAASGSAHARAVAATGRGA